MLRLVMAAQARVCWAVALFVRLPLHRLSQSSTPMTLSFCHPKTADNAPTWRHWVCPLKHSGRPWKMYSFLERWVGQQPKGATPANLLSATYSVLLSTRTS